MKSTKYFVVILFICLFFISCGKTQTEIKGDVFLTNSDDEAIRLSTITVKIIKKGKVENIGSDEISMTDVDYFATTGADGKFSVKVPNGEYIVTADFMRVEFEKLRYHYYWRVPFTASGGEKRIDLNRMNVQAVVNESE
jgi:hypothetical protein